MRANLPIIFRLALLLVLVVIFGWLAWLLLVACLAVALKFGFPVWVGWMVYLFCWFLLGLRAWTLIERPF